MSDEKPDFEIIDYQHLKYSDIAPNVIDQREYTLSVTGLEPAMDAVRDGRSEYYGKEMLVLKGTFTVEYDDYFQGFRLFRKLWPCIQDDRSALKRLMEATGVKQGDATLPQWAEKFGSLNLPALFEVRVLLLYGGVGEYNWIDFRTARSAERNWKWKRKRWE